MHFKVWICCNEGKATALSLGKLDRYNVPPIDVSLSALSDVSEVASAAVRLPVIVSIPLR